MSRYLSWRNFGFVGLSLILTAGFMLQVSDLPSRSLCVYKNLFHFDCPGCGLTRAFLLIPQGQWLQALKLNSASLAVYAFFVLAWMTWLGQNWNANWLSSPLVKRFRVWLGWVIVVLISLQWFYKIWQYFQIHDFKSYIEKLMTSPLFWIYASS